MKVTRIQFHEHEPLPGLQTKDKVFRVWPENKQWRVNYVEGIGLYIKTSEDSAESHFYPIQNVSRMTLVQEKPVSDVTSAPVAVEGSFVVADAASVAPAVQRGRAKKTAA